MLGAELPPLSGACETLDWSLNGRPGVKIVLAPHEYVIGRVLEDGFATSWTTEQSAADAIGHCLPEDELGTSAVALADGDENFIELDQAQIFPFLRYHYCSWVRLRQKGQRDDLVYARGRDGETNQLATFGPALAFSEPATAARVQHLRMMLTTTASSAVQDHLDKVWNDLITTVQNSEAVLDTFDSDKASYVSSSLAGFVTSRTRR